MTPDTTAFDAALSKAMGRNHNPVIEDEDDFLQRVLTRAKRERILAFHSHDSRRDDGDRGFPDLVLVGSSRHMFAELKMNGNTLSQEQSDWRWRLWSAGAWYATWYPEDFRSGKVTQVMRWLHEPDDAEVPPSMQHRNLWSLS